MINELLRNIFRFILLILIQVLIIQHLTAGSVSVYINPFLYVAFILMLPFETPVWVVMLLGFITGLTIDMFCNTQGLHASACVTMATARYYILDAISPRDGYDFGKKPAIYSMGLTWFLGYAAILIFIHHLWLFTVEKFSFSQFHITLLKTVLSTVATLVLVVISQFLMLKQRE